MGNEELIEEIERFKNGLISRATGGDFSNADYKKSRDIIISNIKIKDLVPSFVRTCRTPDDFWNYIQPKYATYADRRRYISNTLNELIAYVESLSHNDTPILNIYAYELGERIGNGGFGEVYKYHHKLLDHDFAIKIFEPLFVSEIENKESEKRFFREAKILFSLDHKNIVKIYDVGRIDEKPFIRIELVNGYNMHEFVHKYSTVNFERSKKPILALCEGLQYAHSKGVIHRDLKPSNFMVTSHGDFKIIDFGISAFLENDKHTKLTRTGEQVAGGLYTDPCLIQNPKLRDVRSDIYSVGAIWYYLLTGKAPYGSDLKNILLQSTEVSTLQANIIMKCLSQNINDRYLNCSELIEILMPPVSKSNKSAGLSSNSHITEVTREYIIDFLKEFYTDQMDNYVHHVPAQYSDYNRVFLYKGRKADNDFLKRLYNLSQIPSYESRFNNFEEEIIQHTIANDDYDIFWVFEDERLGLKNGDDETFLRFLSEMFHPAVRKEKSDWESVLTSINNLLDADGYEIYEDHKISNRAVFSYRLNI